LITNKEQDGPDMDMHYACRPIVAEDYIIARTTVDSTSSDNDGEETSSMTKDLDSILHNFTGLNITKVDTNIVKHHHSKIKCDHLHSYRLPEHKVFLFILIKRPNNL
jgi:hypothetical protein